MNWRSSSRPRRRAAPVVIFGLAALLGCTLDDSAETECRCTVQTDLHAFPRCRNAIVEVERLDENPFSARTPDCPTGTLLFLREPTTPDAALLNVRDAVEGFSPIQYLDQLTEDFLFVPDVDGLQLFREVFNPPADYDPQADADTLWSLDQERLFVFNLLDRTRFQKIDFIRWFDSTKAERLLYDDDQLLETYIFQYRVEFTEQPSPERAAEIFEISGRIEIDVATPSEDNPIWIVRRWEDLRDDASTRRSWTELRGEYSQ